MFCEKHTILVCHCYPLQGLFRVIITLITSPLRWCIHILFPFCFVFCFILFLSVISSWLLVMWSRCCSFPINCSTTTFELLIVLLPLLHQLRPVIDNAKAEPYHFKCLENCFIDIVMYFPETYKYALFNSSVCVKYCVLLLFLFFFCSPTGVL